MHLNQKQQVRPLVSIIVPVYNAERYLSACISSICAQTYPELEIILVDDGSTDSSLSILRQHQKEDSRIHVITGPNAGASHARNLGIDIASGDFLYFFDADDCMEPNAVEILLTQYRKHPESDNLKLVIGSYRNIDADSMPLSAPQKYDSTGIMDLQNDQYLRKVMQINAFPDTKLYLASEIRERHLTWRPVRIGQDVDFFLRYLAGCRGKVCITKECVARYRMVEGSISHTPKLYILDIKAMLDQVEVYAREVAAPEAFFRALCDLRIVHYGNQAYKFHDFPNGRQRLQVLSCFIQWAEEAERLADKPLSEKAEINMARFRKWKRYRLIYTSSLYQAQRKLRMSLRHRKAQSKSKHKNESAKMK